MCLREHQGAAAGQSRLGLRLEPCCEPGCLWVDKSAQNGQTARNQRVEELLQEAGCLVRRRGSAGTVSCLQIFEGLSCGKKKLVLWVSSCQL